MDTTPTSMDKKSKSIKINNLRPFTNHPFQIYEGDRLKKLASSIREIGLQNPIIVRTITEDKGKHEILSGHN